MCHKNISIPYICFKWIYLFLIPELLIGDSGKHLAMKPDSQEVAPHSEIKIIYLC